MATTMAASSCVFAAVRPPLLRASWTGLRQAAAVSCMRRAAAPSRQQLWRGRIGFRERIRQQPVVVKAGFLPVDPWAPNTDQQSVASSLFAASLFPYLGFLYHLTKSKTAPKMTLFGFYFLLAFVGATIPAGIYAKVHYGTSLSNVDWLHGGAESLLTLTNLFIVFGLRNALQNSAGTEEDGDDAAAAAAAAAQEEEEGVPSSK